MAASPLKRAALRKRGTGTLVITGASSNTGGTVVEEGELVIRDVAALGTGRLEVRAGARVTLDIGIGTVSLSSLSLDTAGRIDLGMGRITVAGGIDEQTIRDWLLAGRDGGGWNGAAGIASAAAASDLHRGVGYVFDGVAAVIAYAASGDTNLDGVVDVGDLSNVLASNRLDSGIATGWSEGDFNYDGVLDILDISEFASTGLYDMGTYLVLGIGLGGTSADNGVSPAVGFAGIAAGGGPSGLEAAFAAYAVEQDA